MAATLLMSIVPHDGGEHDVLRLEEPAFVAVAVDRGTVAFCASDGSTASLHGPAVHIFERKVTHLRVKTTDDGGVSVISLAFDPVTPVRAVN